MMPRLKLPLISVIVIGATAFLSPFASGVADEPPTNILPPRTAGGRPATETPCLIAPHSSNIVILSDRPLFVWQGSIEKIALRFPGDNKVFWEQPVVGIQQLAYNEEPLQRGQIYEWLVYYSADSKDPERFIRFQVMPLEESQAIASRLTNLDTPTSEERLTPQTLTLTRINVLINEGLWADAMQELFTIQSPQGAITQYQHDVTEHLCGLRP
jgi:Domain of Unknown Function (DUF928)